MSEHVNKFCKDCRWLRQPSTSVLCWAITNGLSYDDVPRCKHPEVNAKRGGYLVSGDESDLAHAHHERSNPYGESACGNEGKLWEKNIAETS